MNGKSGPGEAHFFLDKLFSCFHKKVSAKGMNC